MHNNGIGYRPDYSRKLSRLLAKFIIKILNLGKSTIFSNEFCQLINLKQEVIFKGEKLYFRTGHGRLKWRVDTFHSEEPLMIEWLKGFDQNDVFIDIGANVGTYSIPAACIAKKVYSIEMDPTNVSILFENIVLNKLQEKIILLPFGIGETNSIQKIFYRDFSKGDALQSIGRESPFDTIRDMPFDTIQPIFKLDHIFDEFGIEQPTKIKIDVDGNEELVFKGGMKTINKAKEIYFEDNGLTEDKSVLKIIESLGFKESKREISHNSNFQNQFNLLFVKE